MDPSPLKAEGGSFYFNIHFPPGIWQFSIVFCLYCLNLDLQLVFGIETWCTVSSQDIRFVVLLLSQNAFPLEKTRKKRKKQHKRPFSIFSSSLFIAIFICFTATPSFLIIRLSVVA